MKKPSVVSQVKDKTKVFGKDAVVVHTAEISESLGGIAKFDNGVEIPIEQFYANPRYSDDEDHEIWSWELTLDGKEYLLIND